MQIRTPPPPPMYDSPPYLTWACIPQIFHNLWDFYLNQINYRKFMGCMPIQGRGAMNEGRGAMNGRSVSTWFTGARSLVSECLLVYFLFPFISRTLPPFFLKSFTAILQYYAAKQKSPLKYFHGPKNFQQKT